MNNTIQNDVWVMFIIVLCFIISVIVIKKTINANEEIEQFMIENKCIRTGNVRRSPTLRHLVEYEYKCANDYNMFYHKKL